MPIGGISGHLGLDDVSEVHYYDAAGEDLVADAMPFNMGLQQGEADVQRSIIGGQSAPSTDWRSGATSLVGHSNQQFQPADYFKVDDTRKVEIKLKLVGLK